MFVFEGVLGYRRLLRVSGPSPLERVRGPRSLWRVGVGLEFWE